MTGIDFFIWALALGYALARHRLHRRHQQRRGRH
jgi:hypothetical protein